MERKIAGLAVIDGYLIVDHYRPAKLGEKREEALVMPVLNESGVVRNCARRVGDQGIILGKPKPFRYKSLSALALAEHHDSRNDLRCVPEMPCIKRFERISLGEALFRERHLEPEDT